MRVDEAWDDDVAGRIDRARAVRGQAVADGGDLVVLEEHVGIGQLAECRVLGEDDRSLISVCGRSSIVPSRGFGRVAWLFDDDLLVDILLMADRSWPAFLTQVTRDLCEVGALADRSLGGPGSCEVGGRLGIGGARRRGEVRDQSEVLVGERQREGDGVVSGSTKCARL